MAVAPGTTLGVNKKTYAPSVAYAKATGGVTATVQPLGGPAPAHGHGTRGAGAPATGYYAGLAAGRGHRKNRRATRRSTRKSQRKNRRASRRH